MVREPDTVGEHEEVVAADHELVLRSGVVRLQAAAAIGQVPDLRAAVPLGPAGERSGLVVSSRPRPPALRAGAEGMDVLPGLDR